MARDVWLLMIMSKTQLIGVALVLVGLSVGGVGVAVANQHDGIDCTNTQSGVEFDVSGDVADHLDQKNNIDCNLEDNNRNR